MRSWKDVWNFDALDGVGICFGKLLDKILRGSTSAKEAWYQLWTGLRVENDCYCDFTQSWSWMIMQMHNNLHTICYIILINHASCTMHHCWCTIYFILYASLKEQARISWPVILRWAQHLEDLAADFRRRVMAFATRVATRASARNMGKRKRNAFWPTIFGLVYFNYNWNCLIISLSYPYMIFITSHMHFSFVSQHLLISGSLVLGQVSLGDSSSESRASPLAEETGTGRWYVSVRSSPSGPWLDGCIWQPKRFVHANCST